MLYELVDISQFVISFKTVFEALNRIAESEYNYSEGCKFRTFSQQDSRIQNRENTFHNCNCNACNGTVQKSPLAHLQRQYTQQHSIDNIIKDVTFWTHLYCIFRRQSSGLDHSTSSNENRDFSTMQCHNAFDYQIRVKHSWLVFVVNVRA